MPTILHTEASLGLGGQELRILAETRWLRDHGWGALLACQPGSGLLAEAPAAGVDAVALRMRGAAHLRARWALPPTVSGTAVREELGLGAGEPVVGLVANIRGSKGHNVFLEAAREILTTAPRARFLIVGDGVGYEEVRRRLSALGLAERVTMTGFRRDIPEVMAALDVLVLPSIRSEATSQVIPQALAVGTPVVATTVGGSPELVRDGETGRLVPPADPHALAGAVLEILGDPARARAMGRAGQAAVAAGLTLDASMTRTTAVYRALLGAAATQD